MAGDAVTRTRFAPSPTGPLHLGHAFSAWVAHQLATPGEFLLRIEDIDHTRCRTDHEAAILGDLRWLGLDWPEPVMRQSDRLGAYRDALARLEPWCYPCRCRRGDIRAVLSAPQEGVLPAGPDGLIYPGSCRGRSMMDAGPDDVIRLNVKAAFDALGLDRVGFRDTAILPGVEHTLSCDQFLYTIGDVILSRRGMGTSYHLAVVVDDAAQGITLVSRGKDLFESSYIHVLLQNLLGFETPVYHHHQLIRDMAGRRLAKRDNARAIAQSRAAGATPQDIRHMVGL